MLVDMKKNIKLDREAGPQGPASLILKHRIGRYSRYPKSYDIVTMLKILSKRNVLYI